MKSSPLAPAVDLPQLAVHLAWAAWFVPVALLAPRLAPGPLALWTIAGVVLHFWNYAVLHNHMHVPIVRQPVGRWIVSRTLGLACGFAYRGYHAHHFNHHRFSGGEGDWGRALPGEGAVRYVLRQLAVTWVWPVALLRHVVRQLRTPRAKAELAFDLVLEFGAIAWLVARSPALGLCWFASVLVGQALTFYLNLAAHHGTHPSDRQRLAVTSHSAAYNALCFNAGLHQAHHLRPQEPWRGLPALTAQLAQEGQLPLDLVTPWSPIHPAWALQVLRGPAKPPALEAAEATCAQEGIASGAGEGGIVPSMQPASGLDEFVRSPLGRYVSGPSYLYFHPRPTLCGFFAWGRPPESEIRGLLRALEIEIAPECPPHASLIELSQVEGVDAGSFGVLRDYLEKRWAQLEGRVTRQALVRPEGLAGAVVAGFYTLLKPTYPVQVFADRQSALAWLGHDDSEVAGELETALQTVTGTSPTVAALRALLQSGGRAGYELGGAAKALGMSERTLQRRLQEAGTTFVLECQLAQVRAAERLLLDTDEKLTVIALEVGCASLQHFSQLFRKHVGVSPSQWRAQKRGQQAVREEA